VRIAASEFRSLHNDGPGDVELVICSVKVEDPHAESEMTPDFWP
jgi:hypothetical protein